MRIALLTLLLGAFFCQNYNAFFNGHFHILHTGERIFHAHPYIKSVGESAAHPTHEHSRMQLLTYELLLASLIALVAIYKISECLKLIFQRFVQLDPITPRIIFYRLSPHRGPPTFCL